MVEKTVAELSHVEIERYDRQLRIKNFGVEGQKKLKKARVVVAGMGGLGSCSALYLTAAGIGNLLLLDMEKVELSNLNRQVLHWTKDIGREKVESAIYKLRQFNPEINIKGLTVEINRDNVHQLIKGASVVVDAQDNIKTRFALNEACVKLGIPLIYGAVYGFEGRLVTIIPGEGPCLRCFTPEDIPTVSPIPIFGATPAIIACLQTVETIKLLTGIGKLCVGRMLIYDGESMSFSEIELKKLDNCPICGRK